MVTHDAENILACLSGAKSVGGIGQPVEVHRAGEQGIEQDDQDRRNERRKQRAEQFRDRGVYGPQKRADQRKTTGGAPNLLRRALDAASRKVRKESECYLKLADYELSPAASATPASAKLAIPVNAATAPRTIGIASAAPVPSPSRISRSSNGRWPRMASSG